MGIVLTSSGKYRATLTINRKRHDSGPVTHAEADKAYKSFVAIRDAIPGYTIHQKADSLSKTDGFSAAAAGWLRSNWVMGAL